MYKGRIFGCIRRFSVAIENKAYIQINGTHTRQFLQSLISLILHILDLVPIERFELSTYQV